MTCQECWRAILTAERAELRGDVPSAVGTHIRTCADCRRRATVAETRTGLLGEMVTARQLHAIPTAAARPLRQRVARLALLPVAAAILGVWHFVAAERGPGAADPPLTVTAPSGVSLTPVAGQKATVIPSANPNVTIIWLSEGGSE